MLPFFGFVLVNLMGLLAGSPVQKETVSKPRNASIGDWFRHFQKTDYSDGPSPVHFSDDLLAFFQEYYAHFDKERIVTCTRQYSFLDLSMCYSPPDYATAFFASVNQTDNDRILPSNLCQKALPMWKKVTDNYSNRLTASDGNDWVYCNHELQTWGGMGDTLFIKSLIVALFPAPPSRGEPVYIIGHPVYTHN